MKLPFLHQTSLFQTTICKVSIVFIWLTTISLFAKTFITINHAAMVFRSATSSHIAGGVRLLQACRLAIENLIACNFAKNMMFVEEKACIATSRGALFSASYPTIRASLLQYRRCEAFAFEKTSLAQYRIFVRKFLDSLATSVNFPLVIQEKKSPSACASIGSNMRTKTPVNTLLFHAERISEIATYSGDAKFSPLITTKPWSCGCQCHQRSLHK